MSNAETVVAELRARGELWDPAPGLTSLRGDSLRLYDALSREMQRVARSETIDEWSVPAAIPLETLARADYFAAFPQLLTGMAHLSDNAETLEHIAASDDAARFASLAMRPSGCALQPAICYHVYAALSGSEVGDFRCVAVNGTCWRREQDYVPLERGWSFTMREIVCIGAPADVETFRQRGLGRALTLAQRLGIAARVATATDPFFAPSTRGRMLLQHIKGLKHELLLPLGDGRTVAAASFNNHERFFGDAFDIRLHDGSAAASACVAFGVERWLLAYLVAHGADARNWPILADEPLSTVAVA